MADMREVLRQEFELQQAAPELRSVIRHYLDRPAGFLRSRLLLETARIYRNNDGSADVAGTADQESARWQLAAGLELLHLFALMHDDWLDRGPAAHRPPADAAPALLLLGGDLLHTLGMRRIRRTVEEHRLDHRIMDIVEDAAVTTINGQVAEMHFTVPPADGAAAKEALFRLYDKKTGVYTCVAPLQVGALCSGSTTARQDLPILRELGLMLGRAFQLGDDLEDIPRLELNGETPWEYNLLRVLQVVDRDSPTSLEQARQWREQLLDAALKTAGTTSHPEAMGSLVSNCIPLKEVTT